MEDERPFLIPLRRRWTLLILPALAFLYFLFIVFLGATRSEVRGVPTDTLVLGGLAFFVLVALIEIPFLIRRRSSAPPPAPEPAPERSEWQAEPMEPAAVPAAIHDDERITTMEEQQGLRVIEYSSPAKSRNRGAVYAKTYVPVTKEHVLRIENLAADARDL